MTQDSNIFNPPATATYAFIAMLLQLPIMVAYGRGREPNVPVVSLAFWFFWVALRLFISMAVWSGSDTSKWWDGKGWCDIDTHLNWASNVGILLASFAINIQLLKLFRFHTKRKTQKQVYQQTVIDIAICWGLPMVIIILTTFMTVNRYIVQQYQGCFSVVTISVATIIVQDVPMLILGVASFVMTLTAVILVFKRGRRSTLESVSYIPSMNTGYFIRMMVFMFIVAIVVPPITLVLFSEDMISAVNGGVSTDLPWSHGKPDGWDQIILESWADAVTRGDDAGSLTSAVIVIQICLSYLMFVCYGTGSVATSFYSDVARVLKLNNLLFRNSLTKPATENEHGLQFNDGIDSSHWPTTPDSEHFKDIEGDSADFVSVSSPYNSFQDENPRAKSEQARPPHTSFFSQRLFPKKL